jgi:inorganic triphosphatase YgiF
VEEIEVEIVVPELPDVPRAVEELAEHLGLEPESLGMTSTYDRMVDTDDLALLSLDHSLRVRQKLDNMFRDSGYRLTYKYPLRDHARLFIREEQKLKLSEPAYEPVLGVLSNLARGVSGQRLATVLEIRELAREANLGDKGRQLNISVDHSSYCLPGTEEPGAEEFVFELESHGIGEEAVLTAADWVLKEIGGRQAVEPKYARGLRLLGRL